MLQNDKYIAFAGEFSVDVVTEQDLDKGIASGDKRAGTFDAKDESGSPVKYLKSWPNLTVEELNALTSSTANTYNHTGGIPYVAIVDPYNLKELKGLPGGGSSKGLQEAVTEATAQLVKEHGGRSMKRSTLRKFKAGVKAIEEQIGKNAAEALTDLNQLKESIAKEPESLKTEAGKLEEKVLDAAKADLDKAEGLITAGDLKGATAILKGYKGLFAKDSELDKRLKELLEKTKPAPAPAK